MLIFGATVNCIPWVYVPEILPLHVRAKGTAVGISANWIWNFFVVMITPTIINNLQWKAYLIFMCLNLSFIPLVVSSQPLPYSPFPLPEHLEMYTCLHTCSSTSATPKRQTSLLKRSIGSSMKGKLCRGVDGLPKKVGGLVRAL